MSSNGAYSPCDGRLTADTDGEGGSSPTRRGQVRWRQPGSNPQAGLINRRKPSMSSSPPRAPANAFAANVHPIVAAAHAEVQIAPLGQSDTSCDMPDLVMRSPHSTHTGRGKPRLSDGRHTAPLRAEASRELADGHTAPQGGTEATLT